MDEARDIPLPGFRRKRGSENARFGDSGLGVMPPAISTDELRKILADGVTPVCDARSQLEYAIAHIPGTTNLYDKEANRIQELYPDRATPTAANDDGRLPLWDKGRRIVVFGNSVQQARKVAEEIAQKAYRNSSYFAGTYEDLKAPGLFATAFGCATWSRFAWRDWRCRWCMRGPLAACSRTTR